MRVHMYDIGNSTRMATSYNIFVLETIQFIQITIVNFIRREMSFYPYTTLVWHNS